MSIFIAMFITLRSFNVLTLCFWVCSKAYILWWFELNDFEKQFRAMVIHGISVLVYSTFIDMYHVDTVCANIELHNDTKSKMALTLSNFDVRLIMM